VNTIEVTRLSKWFGHKVAVSDITCTFGPGVTGILGPNGAGKTTLLRCLVGLLHPSDGSVTVLGKAPNRSPDVLGKVAFVPEHEAVYEQMTARQFIAFNARLNGVTDPAATETAIELVDLASAADRALGGFSKGMRQRAKVAASLAHQPDILILDEPLNGADPVQRAKLIELFVTLGRSGKTVLVSSHVLHEVDRMADRVIAMIDGRLAAIGSVRQLRDLMTDVPRSIRVEVDHPRRLAAAIMATDFVQSVTVEEASIIVDARDAAGFARTLAPTSEEAGTVISRVRPQDESLESVFRYLVGGR